MKFYYGTTMTELAKGRAYRNPEFFMLADPRATDVIVVGKYPRIVDAYEAMGATVATVRDDDWATLNNRDTPRGIYNDTPKATTVGVTHAAAEAYKDELIKESAARQPSRSAGNPPPIPADWQQMPWADLRRLAASVSGTAIINKAQAIAAIETALAENGEV